MCRICQRRPDWAKAKDMRPCAVHLCLDPAKGNGRWCDRHGRQRTGARMATSYRPGYTYSWGRVRLADERIVESDCIWFPDAHGKQGPFGIAEVRMGDRAREVRVADSLFAGILHPDGVTPGEPEFFET